MKPLKFLLIVSATLFGVALLGFVLPKDYVVERTVRVDAPPIIAFAQVNDLSKWEQWLPWKKLDPEMTISFGSKTVGDGASFSWTGEQYGSGSLTVVESALGERIDTTVDFGDRGQGSGYWKFEKDGSGSRVTWGLEGRSVGALGGWFALFANRMVGPEFESGLDGIKEMAEAEAKLKPVIGSALEQVLEEAGQDAGNAFEAFGRAIGEAARGSGK